MNEIRATTLDMFSHETPVFQRIWDDWKNKRHPFKQVDDAEYPFYGMGDWDADIMFIAYEPAYNLEGEKRNIGAKINWPDDFEKVSKMLLKKRMQSDQNRLIEILRSAVSETPHNVPDVYFTNVKKVCSTEICDRYILYLTEEIETVNPKLIVTFGKDAMCTVMRIFYKQQPSGILGYHGVMKKIGGYTLLPFVHWGYADRRGGKVKGKDYEKQLKNDISKALKTH